MKNINGWNILDEEADWPLVEHAEKYPNNKNFKEWHDNFIDDIVEIYAFDMQKRVALDIGGCIGMMAVPFSQYYETVHTFEINPIVRECLQLNVEQYSNIKVHDCGISNTNTLVNFQPSKWTGQGKVSPQGSLQYEVKTIDSFNFEQVDLIKLDVEDHEYNCLEGSIKTLKKYKPIVITEIYSQRNRNNLFFRKKIFDLMYSLDYKLIDVRHTDFIWKY